MPQSLTDVKTAVRTGLLSLDTNTLLSFYRYSAQARDALLEVLSATSDRVWVSHQSAREFWRNRMSVIDNRKSAVKILNGALDRGATATKNAIHAWAKQTAVPEGAEESISARFAASNSDLRQAIEREPAETGTITYDPTTDSVIRTLRPLLQGRVGPPLSAEEMQNAIATFQVRVENQMPPGFADADKTGHPEGGAGDYLVWLESLIEARRRAMPLVIVTRDEKEDWWWRHRSPFIGAR